MAIRLVVQDYCSECYDFDPDVTKPERYFAYDKEYVVNDTIVKCKNARRCEKMKRYLEKQMNKEG